MTVIKLTASVVSDDTGMAYDMPVLITPNGHVRSLTDYLLLNFSLSASWKNKVASSVKLILEYLQANQDNCKDPEHVFSSFARSLYSGTIGMDGLDPSGLGWIPASAESASRTIYALRGFFDHAARKLGKESPSPWIKASSYDQRLNYAAWYRKNNTDFLGHIESKSLPVVLQQARTFRPQGRLSMSSAHVPVFPRALFQRLYMRGYSGNRDPRCVIRDRLILLLMDGGGLRESEPLHLWVQDVKSDPANSKSALVKIYHPQEGKAPSDPYKRFEKEKRAAFLKRKYGLMPRNRLHGSQRVGWKSKVVDHTDNYMRVLWFPPEVGELFLKLWLIHLRYLTTVDRHHPYAFISYEKKHLGEPYSLNALNSNYAAALAKIDETVCKSEGRSTHGHRHAYAQRMRRANLPSTIIRRALHHKSLVSQVSYTKTTIQEVTLALNDAHELLESSQEISSRPSNSHDWSEILKYGFEDIDPDGLLSGPNPKLKES